MKAADWILARPWAMTEEALQVVLAIAERRNDPPEAVEARLGRPLDNAHKVTVRDGVAIVPVVGPISRHADLFTEISGATSIETLARDFRTAIDDRSVKAVILDVDSPGGTVAGVSEFASQVRAARGTKPVVAYVGSQAASAGYWIACAADRVVADSTAMLGSIGVVMGVPRKKASDPIEIVSSQSPHKRPDIETEAGKAQIQATADDLADLFVDAVALSRDVPRETVLSDFGRGGQMVASRAVAAGMADGIGSLEETIACLARGEMPCAPRKKKKPVTQTQEPAMSEQSNPPVSGDPVNAEMDRLKAELARATDALQAKDRVAADAITEAIDARADAFVQRVCGGATATQYAKDVRAAFVMVARDDHAHPLATATARQDAFRAALEAKGQPTKEYVSADPSKKLRALGMDPADEDPTAEQAEAAELDALYERTAKHAATLNGHGRK